MKNWKRCVSALLAALMSVVSISAKDVVICENPDTPHAFPGGILDGIPQYMAKNFKYPKEAWKEEGKNQAILEIILKKDGTVAHVNCLSNKHPALKKELTRVFKRTIWYPATKDGSPVDTKFTLMVDLCPDRFHGEPIPYGLEHIMKDADNSIGKIKETLPVGSELQQAEKIIGEAADVFVRFPRYPITFAMLKSTVGDKDIPVETMDSCWKRYHWIPNPKYGRLGPTGHPMYVRGYNGRTEIWVALMRALQHQFNSSEKTDSAYLDALSLIGDRIIDGDMRETPSKKEIEVSERRIQRMQRDMFNEFVRRDYIGQNTPGWEKITRNYSLDDISGALAYWSNEGMVPNAQVEQLSQLISQEYDARSIGKYAKKESQLNLFGAKAFAIWMQEGDEGLDRFLAQIRAGEPSKQLLKYLSKLEKNKAENAALLADRRAVLQSLACLVPPEGTDAAGVKAFYDRRKAVEKVFPLKWLMKP